MTFEEIQTEINSAFRNYVTEGVPASGDHEPVKQEVRYALSLLTIALDDGGFSAPPDWAADLAGVVSQLEEIDAAVGQSEAAAASAEDARDDAVTARTGAETARDVAEAAVENLGVVKFYDTKADADADLAGIAEGAVVQVFADETENDDRTTYMKDGGVLVFKANNSFLRPDGSNVDMSTGEAETFRDTISAANGVTFDSSGDTSVKVYATTDGIGIGVIPSVPFQVGANTGISDPSVVSGRTISGSRAAYGHAFSDFPVINATLSTGDGEYAYNSFDARPQVGGSGVFYNHVAGYQNDPQISDGCTVRDGWGYLSNGDITGGAAVTKYTHFLAANFNGNIGYQFGFRASTMSGLSGVWAFYVDEVTNNSKFGKIGICLDNADYAVNPSQALDINAPAGLPCAINFRVDMAFKGSYGVARATNDIVSGSAAGDFVERVQGGKRGISTNSGASFGFEVLANNGGIRVNGGPTWLTGTGTPEGSKTAPVGSIYSRTDGGATTTLYVKESGTGNTGWVAK